MLLQKTYFRLLIIFILSFSNVALSEVACEKNYPAGLPIIHESNHEISSVLCRKGYAIQHDNDFKNPKWVAEMLLEENLEKKDVERVDMFIPDPNLEDGKKAMLDDYKKSGYDRGHMAPAADLRWSAEAMKESFYLSNIVPQNSRNNRQIWAELEKKVRKWTSERSRLYVITGPIYYSNTNVKFIGKNKVAVPDSLFKLVFDLKTKEYQAFVIPNKPYDRSTDLTQFKVNLYQLEKLSGIDFIPNLDKQSRNNLLDPYYPVNKVWE